MVATAAIESWVSEAGCCRRSPFPAEQVVKLQALDVSANSSASSCRRVSTSFRILAGMPLLVVVGLAGPLKACTESAVPAKSLPAL